MLSVPVFAVERFEGVGTKWLKMGLLSILIEETMLIIVLPQVKIPRHSRDRMQNVWECESKFFFNLNTLTCANCWIVKRVIQQKSIVELFFERGYTSESVSTDDSIDLLSECSWPTASSLTYYAEQANGYNPEAGK